MIDTMTIFHQVTRVEYDHLKNHLERISLELSGKRIYPDRNDKNALVTHCFCKLGLQEIKLRCRVDKGYRAIEIWLRPKLLIEEGNYYDTTQIYEMEKVRKVFNQIVEQFDLPDLMLWRVKRFDPAVDLNIYQDLIPIYMFSYKKANIPLFMLSNRTTQKYLQSPNNLYLCSSNVRVNIYDRYATLVNKLKEGYKVGLNVEAVRNKMRFEVQHKNCRGQLYKYLNNDFCRASIEYYYNSIIGSGDYYTLDKARMIISQNTKSVLKSIELKDFIKSINQSGSVWKAKIAYLQNSSNRIKASKQFSYYLQQLEALNVNPVVLPDDLGIETIPNVKSQLDSYFKTMNDYSKD
jgi:hypothetical protein